jgi:hypothetical protein
VTILKNCKPQCARTGEVAEFVVDNTTRVLEALGDVSVLRDTRLGAAGRERAGAYPSEIVVSACEQAFSDVLKTRNRDSGMQEAQ